MCIDIYTIYYILLSNCIKWLEFSAQNGLHDLAIKCVDGVIADYAQDLMQSRNTTQLSRQAMVQLHLRDLIFLVFVQKFT